MLSSLTHINTVKVDQNDWNKTHKDIFIYIMDNNHIKLCFLLFLYLMNEYSNKMIELEKRILIVL